MFGHIDESVWAYSSVLPEKPLWITEFGVLDRPNDSAGQIARYATDMVRYLKTQYPGRIAALVWYAWAQGMHNGYGLVDKRRQPAAAADGEVFVAAVAHQNNACSRAPNLVT